MTTIYELKIFLEKLIDDGYSDFDIKVMEGNYNVSIPVKAEVENCYEDKWNMGKSYVVLKNEGI